MVDEVGASLGARLWIGLRGIVVVREEALYVCGVEGRGSRGCYAYEGSYLSLDIHGMTSDLLWLFREVKYESILT